MSDVNAHALFVRELRSLLKTPYAFIHLQTWEEDRAIELILSLAEDSDREVREWSARTNFDGSPGAGDFARALGVAAGSPTPSIFVFKDVHPFLHDPLIRRQLRELEPSAATFGKTLIFISPQNLPLEELEKDFTRLIMPLPDRATIQEEVDNVFPAVEFFEIDRDALVSGAMGLTVKEAHRAFHRVRVQVQEAMERNQPFDLEKAILREKQRLVGTSDVLEFHPLDEGLEDMGGLEELKRWLGERKRAFSDEARAFGLPSPRGVLLVGVQGCGKSLTAKVVGRHWGLPLLRLDLGAVFDGKRSPEESLRSALRTCDAISPCVLWMDEIEKGFSDSGDGRSSRVLGSLLTWQQEKSTPVFLVATANDVTRLPPELMRKGRFDEIFFVDLPDIHERREILKIHLLRRGRFMSDDIVETLAKRTEYFSGAELEQVIVSALYTAFADGRELSAEDLDYAVSQTIPLYRTYEDQIKNLRDWADGRARRASRPRRVLDFFDAT